MCSSKLLVREKDRGGVCVESTGWGWGWGAKETERQREKTPFGAEMERIDSVAPSGKRHF